MTQERHKIIFFGTPEFASFILEKLVNAEFKPLMVITAPDKPVGRKKIFTSPPVKILAQKHQIPVLQTDSLRKPGIIQKIFSLTPDLFIIAAYGLILPSEILNIPKFGSLNIHPSLLPKYRGASPIQASILAGDKKTGVTIMLMDEEMDHGPVIAQKKLRINKETTSVLSQKLAQLGADLLIKILPKWFKEKIKPKPQNHKKATFTRQIKKEQGKVDWSMSAQRIEQMFRAYQPWPGIFTAFKIKNQSAGWRTKIENRILKIIEADVLKIKHNKQPGTIFLSENKNLAVACKENALILKQIQLEGKKSTAGKSFLNGHPQIIDTILDWS